MFPEKLKSSELMKNPQQLKTKKFKRPHEDSALQITIEKPKTRPIKT